MGEEIAFENGRISDFQGLVTLTLTLDRVILHTVMHHSSSSTHIPKFIEIEETFCGRTDVRTGGRTFETHFIRSTQRSRPNKAACPRKYISATNPTVTDLCRLRKKFLMTLDGALDDAGVNRSSSSSFIASPAPAPPPFDLSSSSIANELKSCTHTPAPGDRHLSDSPVD